MALTTAQTKAIPILCAGHLHQSLWLPSTAEHLRLRVSYGTTSNFDDTSLPAVLFIGPMFGGRWTTLELDKLARESGVRVICPDRPSMGGSTPVALDLRMKVWLETVPALLDKVGVSHVSLITHSAGALYTLNTLFHLRGILDPKAPYVAFMAPWVPTSESKATLMSLSAKLPTPFLDCLAPLQGFFLSKVNPTLSFSGGLVSSSMALLSPPTKGSADADEAPPGSDKDAAEKYGVDVETAKAMRSLAVKYGQAEETKAANEEAKLCLRKGERADWGVGDDYMALVRAIAEREEAAASTTDGNGADRRLQVDACFGESDVMIGKGGEEYFEACWRQDGVAARVGFESRAFEKTNHDTVLLDFRRGALRRCLKRIAGERR